MFKLNFEYNLANIIRTKNLTVCKRSSLFPTKIKFYGFDTWKGERDLNLCSHCSLARTLKLEALSSFDDSSEKYLSLKSSKCLYR
jgi:hypothetical protein